MPKYVRKEATGPAEVSFVANSNDAANAGGHKTFSGFNIGTAAPDRHVIVAVIGNRNAASSVDSVTVGGQSCSLLVEDTSGLDYQGLYITDAPIAAGTTADIVVNISVAYNDLNIATYRATGIQSLTAINTYSDTSDPLSVSAAFPAQGFFVGLAFTKNGSASFTWAGATEDTDQNVVSSATTFSTASENAAAASSPTVSATITGTVSNESLIGFTMR